jgi:hypothetical protein
MKADIRDGKMQFWAIHDDEHVKAGVVVSAKDSATRKIWVELLAGEGMDEWADELIETLREVRVKAGASCVEASCRPGLAQFLKKRGWKRKAIIMGMN